MFRASSSVVFPRVTAMLLASCLASTSLVPLAQAQDKAPVDKPAAKKDAGGAAKPAAGKPTADKSAEPKVDKKTRDAARKAFGDGTKAFNSGDYMTAQDNFQKALNLIPSPHAAYWVAASLDKQDKTTDAIAAYDAFLADPKAGDVGEDKLAEAKSRLDALKGKLVGEVNLTTTPPGANVSIDGQPEPGETPMVLKLSPGAHRVAISLARHETKEIEINVNTGEKTQQKVELASSEPMPAAAPIAPAATAEPPPTEPAPPPEKRSKVPAYVTLGIAGAGAVVGTFFGIKALSAASDFDENPTAEAADDAERNALIADMAFGVAITLGVTGIVLLTSSDSAAPGGSTAKRVQPLRAKLQVAPFVSPNSGGAAARWTF